MTRIALYLEGLCWSRQWIAREHWYISPDQQQAVVLARDWWELRRFTDADADTDSGTRAVGQWKYEAEGEDLAELQAALMGVTV